MSSPTVGRKECGQPMNSAVEIGVPGLELGRSVWRPRPRSEAAVDLLWDSEGHLWT